MPTKVQQFQAGYQTKPIGGESTGEVGAVARALSGGCHTRPPPSHHPQGGMRVIGFPWEAGAQFTRVSFPMFPPLSDGFASFLGKVVGPLPLDLFGG